jgi:hypothetical protein
MPDQQRPDDVDGIVGDRDLRALAGRAGPEPGLARGQQWTAVQGHSESSWTACILRRRRHCDNRDPDRLWTVSE